MIHIENTIYLGEKPKTKEEQLEDVIAWLQDNLPNTLYEQVGWMKEYNKGMRLLIEYGKFI